uniref:Rab-GAP TBC domain-containing protein n=1 Tax=Angiostrongylus cantonensis TaxID=6313 RepID=A0A0K0D915_ANGCA
MYKIVSRISQLTVRQVEQLRSASAWLNPARSRTESGPEASIDAEKLFINPEVQQLLVELTGVDLEGKVFRARRTAIQQRSHFALMTDERLSETMDKMRREAQRFLSFIPLKEPRSEEDRTVVVREVDGTLRTATPEEHDRMNRVYYEKPNRPVFPPPVFGDPYLQLVQCVFDRTVDNNDFEVLHSTRHFATLVFYLALNGNIPPLLNYFGGQGR